MRFGLIGAGRIGSIHGRNVAARADSTLAMVADADAQVAGRLAASTGARVGDVDEIMATKDVDAVLVCAPTGVHADLIEMAAKAGKAVFCEKPVDLNSDRIRACLATVGKAGTPLMIGFNRRFDPNFAALKHRLDSGSVGNVEIVTITSRDPAPRSVTHLARSGGLFRDMMIHDFDMARFLLGEEPTAVTAAGSALVNPEIGKVGDVDTAVVLLETASGRLCQISNSRRATYGYDQRIEVHGERGMIRAGNIHETTIEVAGVGGFTTDPIQRFFLERYAIAFRLELDAFIDAVSAGRAPYPSGLDGLRAQILADAATESRRSRRRIEIVGSGPEATWAGHSLSNAAG